MKREELLALLAPLYPRRLIWAIVPYTHREGRPISEERRHRLFGAGQAMKEECYR